MRLPLFFFTFLLLPFSSFAATFQNGDTIEVRAEENAYALGKVVQLSLEAREDVYLAGETVHINAPVRGDAMLAGQTVSVNGNIGEDLHAAGGTVLVNASVRGESVLLGPDIVTSPTARLFGVAFLAGEKIVMEGKFENSVRIFGDSVSLGGSYAKSVEVHASEISFSEGAVIRGDLLLFVPESTVVTLPDGIVQGKVETKLLTKSVESRTPFLKGIHVFLLISKLLIGSLIIMLLRPFALHFGADVKQTYLKMFGYGFLVLVVPPLAAFFLLLPILTIPLSLLLMLLWGVALYVGSLLSGLLLAQLLLPLGKECTTLRILGTFAFMTLLLSFVKFIPFLGTLFAFVIFVLTLGALALYKAKSFKVLRKAGMV